MAATNGCHRTLSDEGEYLYCHHVIAAPPHTALYRRYYRTFTIPAPYTYKGKLRKARNTVLLLK